MEEKGEEGGERERGQEDWEVGGKRRKREKRRKKKG